MFWFAHAVPKEVNGHRALRYFVEPVYHIGSHGRRCSKTNRELRLIFAATSLAASLVTAALSAHPALADITGPAIVTDGDSIKIDGQRIRIHGIDAPEITIGHSGLAM